jgi:hypothetical protein
VQWGGWSSRTERRNDQRIWEEITKKSPESQRESSNEEEASQYTDHCRTQKRARTGGGPLE